ncbi:MAG: CpaF family protein [Bdellovibrionales bacterium]
MEIQRLYKEIKSSVDQLFGAQLLSPHEVQAQNQFRSFIEEKIALVPEAFRERLAHEFFGLGPLNVLLDDPSLTEILVNGPDSVWFEKNGRLYKHDDHFYSSVSFENALERLSAAAGKHLSLNHPFLEGHLPGARISIVERSLTHASTIISIRKHPKNPWTFDRLETVGWCTTEDRLLLEKLVQSDRNFLIIGETGSGKTSIANACLQSLGPSERVIAIEDSSELQLPNQASIKLLTRDDPFGELMNIDQQELLRRSLRLRPDRLVMGEIRNKEAKDFLMLLATGHKGCFATLHAEKANEALIRLEMLIQLGAPQWSLSAIRRLIFLSLHAIVVTGRNRAGQRQLQGIYKLSSLEDSGLTLDSVASKARETTSSEWA